MRNHRDKIIKAYIFIVIFVTVCATCNPSSANDGLLYRSYTYSINGIRNVTAVDDGVSYYGAVDEEGNILAAPTKDSKYVWSGNGYIITSPAGSSIKKGFTWESCSEILNVANGERLYVPAYLTYYDGINGVAMKKENGAKKFALTDSGGIPITGFEYNSITGTATDDVLFAHKDDWKFGGVIDRSGNVVLPFEYMISIIGTNPDYHVIAKGGIFFGVMRKRDGHIVIPPIYGPIGGYYDNYCKVMNDGKSAFFNLSGVNVTGFVYDNASDYSEGFAAVLINGKWGYIDTQQQMVIVPMYDEAGSFKNGLANVTYEGVSSVIENPLKESRQINVYWNDMWMYSELPAIIEANSIMLPVRDIARLLNAYVEWAPKSQEVELINSTSIVRFKIGSKTASINTLDDGLPGISVTLSSAVKIIGGRTYVPLRFIAESMGYSVNWDAASHSVFVQSI